MNDITRTFGWYITAVNLMLIVVMIYVIRYEFCKVIDKEIRKKTLDFHFILLLMSIIFFVANAISAYRFYMNLIAGTAHPALWTLTNALSDRVCMLFTSIGFIILGHNFKKQWLED